MKRTITTIAAMGYNHLLPVAAILLFFVAVVPSEAFVPPHYGNLQKLASNNDLRLVHSNFLIDNTHSSQIQFMAENDDEEIDDSGDDGGSIKAESPSQVISAYKSKISTRRTGTEARPGSSAQTPIDVTMKFGGSSLANSDRVDHVANLIKDRINPPPNEDGSPSDETPVRPRAVICSAMGKTTNSLLAAGEMALEGRVDIEALRTLHLGTCRHFDLPERTCKEVEKLLNECEDMLNGVRLIQELSPKSLDQLVSYGERCSVRIMAARLNQIGGEMMSRLFFCLVLFC